MASSSVILKSISFKKEFDSNSTINSSGNVGNCICSQDEYFMLNQLKTKLTNKIHSNPDPPVSFLSYVEFSIAKGDSIATLNFFLVDSARSCLSKISCTFL